MSNHYHLLVETLEGNLSNGMRQLNGFYSQTYNRRHQKNGHVSQGRYKATMVEKESYLLELCRYVELNPARARMVHKAGDWPGVAIEVGGVNSPSWLATDFILSSFAAKKGIAIKAYIKFLGEGKNGGKI
ncbi:MAG: transposase [Arenicella sp.]|nr:transposase [Arenicella sp.]